MNRMNKDRWIVLTGSISCERLRSGRQKPDRRTITSHSRLHDRAAHPPLPCSPLRPAQAASSIVIHPRARCSQSAYPPEGYVQYQGTCASRCPACARRERGGTGRARRQGGVVEGACECDRRVDVLMSIVKLVVRDVRLKCGA